MEPCFEGHERGHYGHDAVFQLVADGMTVTEVAGTYAVEPARGPVPSPGLEEEVGPCSPRGRASAAADDMQGRRSRGMSTRISDLDDGLRAVEQLLGSWREDLSV